MIATYDRSKQDDQIPNWHPRFLALVPAIRHTAEMCFQKLRPELRQDMVEEVIAYSLLAYARLVERGKEDLAFPSALARFGVAQVRQGRQVGCRLNSKDVSSRWAQQRKGFKVERLDKLDSETGEWREILIQDKRSTPADIAASRVDFAAWLATMSSLRREIARCLSTGMSTREAAQQFDVSPGRISQIRREFQESWHAFHGEPMEAAAAA
jgi:hypothetical protein